MCQQVCCGPVAVALLDSLCACTPLALLYSLSSHKCMNLIHPCCSRAAVLVFCSGPLQQPHNTRCASACTQRQVGAAHALGSIVTVCDSTSKPNSPFSVKSLGRVLSHLMLRALTPALRADVTQAQLAWPALLLCSHSWDSTPAAWQASTALTTTAAAMCSTASAAHVATAAPPAAAAMASPAASAATTAARPAAAAPMQSSTRPAASAACSSAATRHLQSCGIVTGV